MHRQAIVRPERIDGGTDPRHLYSKQCDFSHRSVGSESLSADLTTSLLGALAAAVLAYWLTRRNWRVQERRRVYATFVHATSEFLESCGPWLQDISDNEAPPHAAQRMRSEPGVAGSNEGRGARRCPGWHGGPSGALLQDDEGSHGHR